MPFLTPLTAMPKEKAEKALAPAGLFWPVWSGRIEPGGKERANRCGGESNTETSDKRGSYGSPSP